MACKLGKCDWTDHDPAHQQIVDDYNKKMKTPSLGYCEPCKKAFVVKTMCNMWKDGHTNWTQCPECKALVEFQRDPVGLWDME